ncbi:thioredoxin family protein [Ekhidna sp.]|uniref:thioredoxin family protein n=1 Tax=Ekhidna sp. TaxID=2608089 RepID=UPI003B5070AE
MSLNEALSLANEENKFVFVEFYADWSLPSKRMEKEVFSVDSVGLLFNNHFIAIRIDAEKEQQSLVESIGITSYPTLVYYDPLGRIIYRHQGEIFAKELYKLSESLIHLNDRLAAYKKNDRKKINVYEYATSLRHINENKAGIISRKYLIDVDEDEYSDPQNWELIKRFVRPWDRVLFARVTDSEILKIERPEDFPQYLIKSMDMLLEKAIETENSSFMRTRRAYIEDHSNYFQNPDSLLLIGELEFASQSRVEEYPKLIEEYVKKYLPEDGERYASIAYDLTQNYFHKQVLDFAIELANRSLALKPNLNSYLALSAANEKLSQFKAAYGYMLLAFQFADAEMQQALSDREKELKYKMEFELESGVSLFDDLGEDGRFTLGAGNQRLMYGYPIPQSTSHFVVNVDNKLGCNAPIAKSVQHLKGITKYTGTAGTPTVTTTFKFEGVTIKQSLTPVDKKGNVIERGLAQYYRVTYSLVNETGRTKKIGLSVLFDTMMDDNDACPIATNGHIIPHEYLFSGKNIPNELLFYRNPDDTSDLVGSALITELEATRPDLMVVGRWPYLHRVQWDFQTRKVRYGDSAYMLRWSNRYLNTKSEINFITYYGLPTWKRPILRVVMKDDKGLLTTTNTIYFEHDKHDLDINAKMKIQEMIENESIDIVGVILQGYADVSGSSNYNFELSKRRIKSVGKIFRAFNIPYVPKPYGFDNSDRDYYSQKYGNIFDRKVEAILYYRLKHTENASLSVGIGDE